MYLPIQKVKKPTTIGKLILSTKSPTVLTHEIIIQKETCRESNKTDIHEIYPR